MKRSIKHIMSPIWQEFYHMPILDMNMADEPLILKKEEKMQVQRKCVRLGMIFKWVQHLSLRLEKHPSQFVL